MNRTRFEAEQRGRRGPAGVARVWLGLLFAAALLAGVSPAHARFGPPRRQEREAQREARARDRAERRRLKREEQARRKAAHKHAKKEAKAKRKAERQRAREAAAARVRDAKQQREQEAARRRDDAIKAWNRHLRAAQGYIAARDTGKLEVWLVEAEPLIRVLDQALHGVRSDRRGALSPENEAILRSAYEQLALYRWSYHFLVAEEHAAAKAYKPWAEHLNAALRVAPKLPPERRDAAIETTATAQYVGFLKLAVREHAAGNLTAQERDLVAARKAARQVANTERKGAERIVVRELWKLYIDSRRFAAAEPLLWAELDLGGKHEGPDDEASVFLVNQIAKSRFAQHKYFGAIIVYERVLKYLDQASGANTDDTCDALLHIVSSEYHVGNYATAQQRLERAVRLAESKAADAALRHWVYECAQAFCQHVKHPDEAAFFVRRLAALDERRATPIEPWKPKPLKDHQLSAQEWFAQANHGFDIPRRSGARFGGRLNYRQANEAHRLEMMRYTQQLQQASGQFGGVWHTR